MAFKRKKQNRNNCRVADIEAARIDNTIRPECMEQTSKRTMAEVRRSTPQLIIGQSQVAMGIYCTYHIFGDRLLLTGHWALTTLPPKETPNVLWHIVQILIIAAFPENCETSQQSSTDAFSVQNLGSAATNL